MHRVRVLLPGLLLVGACSPVNITTPSASSGRSPAIETPSATAIETVEPSASGATTAPTPAPSSQTTGMTEQERGDWFWEYQTHFGDDILVYDSLADITANANLIVRGRLVDMRPGEIWPFSLNMQQEMGPLRAAFAIVEIDEVLKGTPQTKSPGTIIASDLGLERGTLDDLPEGEVTLFLMNYAQQRIETDSPPSPDEDDRYYYVRPNGYQGVLRNVDGRVWLVDPERPWENEFPVPLDGKPYDEVVDRIRELAGR